MEKFEPLKKPERNIEEDARLFSEAIDGAQIREIETRYDAESADAFKKDLEEAKLFILGEMHGVQENADVIYTLFKKFGFRTLGLEWNAKSGRELQKYAEGVGMDFGAVENSADGRITAGHFALIKKLKDEGLLEDLVCFDEGAWSPGWNARDAAMAKNILANLSDSKMLAVAGNLHAEVEPVVLSGEEHHPMGENIKKQIPRVPSGSIEYRSGHFHNLGVREFARKKENTPAQARFYRDNDGRYIFELPEAHAAIVPNPKDVIEEGE